MRFKCEKYAMEVLDSQYSHIKWDYRGFPLDTFFNKEQVAYYEGFKKAFEIVLSDGYVYPCNIEVDKDGRHTIVEGEYGGNRQRIPENRVIKK